MQVIFPFFSCNCSKHSYKRFVFTLIAHSLMTFKQLVLFSQFIHFDLFFTTLPSSCSCFYHTQGACSRNVLLLVGLSEKQVGCNLYAVSLPALLEQFLCLMPTVAATLSATSLRLPRLNADKR